MLRFVVYATAILLAGSALAQVAKQVQIGGEPSLDACGALGRVTGLDPKGDNFLSVRSGPGIRFKRIDRLGPDQEIWLCDASSNWFGVVYSKDSEAECGVTSPEPIRKAYSGPCQTGWVYKKFVLLTAG